MSESDKDSLGKVTHAGDSLIKGWQHATRRLGMARDELAEAIIDCAECERELARWLLPGDAKLGETIGVWYGDSIITAAKTSGNPDSYAIVVRDRGRSLR